MFKRISQRNMVIQTIRRRTDFVANFVLGDHTLFLATPIFVVNVHTKMRVVENFGQLSNVMYQNIGLLTQLGRLCSQFLYFASLF